MLLSSDPNRTNLLAPDTQGRGGLWARLGGAVLFYTRLPWPGQWQPSFRGIAALAPLIGVMLGGGLALVDGGLGWLGVSRNLTSGLVVGLWLWLTGGLHLDGAMDTADGLAAMDPQRRLEVMADSRTGAFGTMAAIAILGLKTLALADLALGRGWWLVLAALWGRWGQVVAVARYPYLRPAGKGALHQAHLRLPQDILLGLGLGVFVTGLWAGLHPEQTWWALGSLVGGILAALGTGAWLNQRLGGHTGDTYGATLEWTETLVLCLGSLLSQLSGRV
ncbi:MAG TPA: adenosylcobinamide-GDP ribazoletransferase [Leptolyngbyaceae cyanobacterium M65_K2018_010]|nr:adenosylcobinamide-GDP ribazoletransferase [Leptolyngbyaceae cyanobacterium M65_K2018_010]